MMNMKSLRGKGRFQKILSGKVFYRKSTIGTTVAPIETNNDIIVSKKQIEKFPLVYLMN